LLNLRELTSKLRKSSLAHNAGWMALGQGGNFFLQAGYFLLIARILGVTEYGVFAGVFALVNTVTPYSSLGSSMIFMRYVSADRNSAQVYWGNTCCTIVVTSLLMTGVLAIAGAKLLGPGSLGLIVVLVLSNCCMGQVVSAAGVIFQTFERLKSTAGLQALSNALRLVSIGLLALFLHHATAFQCSLAILASTAIAATTAVFWVQLHIGSPSVSGKLFRRHFWEGIGFSFAGSTQSVYNDVDKLMLSHYGMNAANGIYTVAYRVVDFASTPVSAIDAAVLPRYFALNRDGLGSVGQMARKILPVVMLAGLAAAGSTLLAAPVIVRIIGHGYAETLLAIRWLCWLPVLRSVHQLTGGVLTATGRQNYRTAAQLTVAVLNVSLNMIWIPRHGWLGAAWSSLISDCALGVLNLFMVSLVLSRSSRVQEPEFHEEQVK
jgi:O-antigen/teichoic acid export membrane protein